VDLSSQVWIASGIGLLAVGIGAGLAKAWITLLQIWQLHHSPAQAADGSTATFSWLRSAPHRGSFQLVSMVGNTGYIGFPICLAIGGSEYFSWALFYDMIGTLFGAYGFGVWVASCHSQSHATSMHVLGHLIRTPSLWAFGVGLGLSGLSLPLWMERGLMGFAWLMIPLSLMVLGMRLAVVKQWQSFQPAGIALMIKLLILPCVIGLGLMATDLPATAKLLMVVQSGMPPAIATLVLSEEFDLDRGITVTALAVGNMALLSTLPLWLLIWG
jgi:hypothetical protein